MHSGHTSARRERVSCLDRRLFLATGVASLLGFGSLPAMAESGNRLFVPLGRLGTTHGLKFGFALDPHRLADEPGYAGFVAEQASIVVPENALKWATVHPAPDRFDFAPADMIATFARSHDIAMRGHTFCWHRSLPDWVTQNVTRQNAKAVLVDHIQQVANHYRGTMQSWDVANEVINLPDGLPGGLRDTFWHRMLGPSYLDIAFHAAKEADPAAVLCYSSPLLQRLWAGSR
jgi:endo-1,4-beta-xylanase